MHIEIAQRAAQFAKGAVHGRDLTIEILPGFGQALIQRAIRLQCLMRVMGRAKPDHGEEWLFFSHGLADELDGKIGGDVGAVSFELRGLAIHAEDGIEIEEVWRGDPFIETTGSRTHRAGFLHRAEVPFAKVAGVITGRLQGPGNRDLLRADGVPPGKAAEAVRRATSHHTAARG